MLPVPGSRYAKALRSVIKKTQQKTDASLSTLFITYSLHIHQLAHPNADLPRGEGLCDLAINSGKPSRPLIPAVGNTLLFSRIILDRVKPFDLRIFWEFNGVTLDFSDKTLEFSENLEKRCFARQSGLEKWDPYG